MSQTHRCKNVMIYESGSGYNNQNHRPLTSPNFDHAGFAQFNTTNFVNLK